MELTESSFAVVPSAALQDSGCGEPCASFCGCDHMLGAGGGGGSVWWQRSPSGVQSQVAPRSLPVVTGLLSLNLTS